MAKDPVTEVLNEIQGWRLAGAAVWHAGLFVLGCTAWGMLPGILTANYHAVISSIATGLSVAGISTFLLMYGLQFASLLGHRRVMSAYEAPPFYLAALGLHGRSWLSVIISRVILRNRKLTDLINTAWLLASTTTAAVTMLCVYRPLLGILHPATGAAAKPGAPFTFSFNYGVCLGCLYTAQHLIRCRDVVAHPVVHRHRLYRLRQRVLGCIIAAVQVATTALLLTLLSVHKSMPPLGLCMAQLHAASLCVFGWMAAHATLEVVTTEPLRLVASGYGPGLAQQPGADPVRTVLQALAYPDLIVQDLALRELASLAEGSSAADATWRSYVFADDTGRGGWSLVAGYLLTEVKDWSAAIAAALPSISGDARQSSAAAPSALPARVKWNVMSMSPSTGSRAVSRAQDMAAWTVRARCYRVSLCLRALSGLAAAARTQDRYGVVLLASPLLADVTAGLADAMMAAQQFTKMMGPMTARTATGPVTAAVQHLLAMTGPPPHPTLQPVELCAAGVEDTARGAIYRVAQAFGPSLQTALKDLTTRPACVSASDVQAVLNNVLKFQE